MTHIIAGHFEQQDQVHQAISQLIDAGFSDDNISAFYVNPAGQHDLYPIGGDRDKSPGAKESGDGAARGMATGGALGAAIGVAGIPVAGPVGPVMGSLVGAHIGGLIGSLSSLKEKGESEEGGENETPPRKSGMLVAVSVPEPGHQDNAIRILESVGANRIELAEGTIANGDWQDFDPLSLPLLLKPGSPEPGIH